VLVLDEGLSALNRLDPRKAQVVELRIFGGLSVEESAEALGVSRETVLRDCRLAKAWLRREMKKQ
jgi:RNA polymerase sigma factor (sigma-70 family)